MIAINTEAAAADPQLEDQSIDDHATEDLDLNELFEQLADPAIDIPDLCANFDIPPTKLAALLASPRVQAILESIEQIAAVRERLIASKARPELLEALLFNATRESAAPETQRKAAAQLLRLTKPTGATTRRKAARGAAPTNLGAITRRAAARDAHTNPSSIPCPLTTRLRPHPTPARRAPTAAPPHAGASADTPAHASNRTPGIPAAASHRSRTARPHQDAGTAHPQTPAPTRHLEQRPDDPYSNGPRTPRTAALPQPPHILGGDRITGWQGAHMECSRDHSPRA